MSYYGYDALDRLAWLRADAFGVDAATYYSYDAVGNRTALLPLRDAGRRALSAGGPTPTFPCLIDGFAIP